MLPQLTSFSAYLCLFRGPAVRTVGSLVRGAVADVLLTPHVDPDPGSLQTRRAVNLLLLLCNTFLLPSMDLKSCSQKGAI